MTSTVANGGGKPAQRRKVMVVAEPTRESAAALHYVLSHVIFDNDILYLLHVENPNFWKNKISCFIKQSSTSSATDAREGIGCNGGGGGCLGDNVDFLDQMKSACELVHPKLKVKVSKVESEAREGIGCNGGGGGCLGDNVDFLDQMKSACELVHPKLKVKVSKVESEARDKAYVIISQTKVLGIDLLVVGKRQSLSNAILRQRRNGSIRGDTAEYLVQHSKCTCVAVQRKGQNGGYLLHTKTHRNFWLLA